MFVTMSDSWFARRSWEFFADMNGDGAVTIRDVWPWLKWLYFLPGDALIAWLGPTALGRFLELGPGVMGGPISAGLSFFVWYLGLWILLHLVFGIVGTVLDIRAMLARAVLKIRMFLGDREYRQGMMIDWRGERDRARDEHYAGRSKESQAELGGHPRHAWWVYLLYLAAIVGLLAMIYWLVSA